jgi:phosphonate transport system substrate-binding protein
MKTAVDRSPATKEITAMTRRPLRIATFLAPAFFPFYAFLVRRISRHLGVPVELFVGTSYEQMLTDADAGFLCGLAYLELTGGPDRLLEPLAAPVLCGERYGGRPVYFSDVVVRRDSPCRSFADLRGRCWSFNEALSHSGYGVTRYHLVRLGETRGFFGQVIEAGWHERSLQLVCDGQVDASAIDSHVLAVTVRDRPELAERLRVIDSLGPSTIQPFVASRRLPMPWRVAMRTALLGVGRDPGARRMLAQAMVDGFAPVDDGNYDDLRRMRATCAAADFLTLR